MKVITDAGPRPRVCGLSLAISELVKGSRAAAAGGALLASLAIVPNTVVAQQQGDESVLEEVVVTGSRIVRQDFTANSPVQTVDETLFDETSAIGVETVLNRLPQFVPAVTQFSTGDVQQTATNTVGASTVSLRGLGANRNLVLINGRRAMPVDPRMVVDTNTIPSAAIQRVEVISGGASAVYGADAVGGVVNFILKDNYEGASVDVRFGDTEHGGNQTVNISALFGANVAGDRGNVMLGIERDTRSKQYRWERDWRVEDMANPNTAGGGFAFGSATWFTNEWDLSGTKINPNFVSTAPVGPFNPRTLGNQQVANPLFNPGAAPGATNSTVVSNSPPQSAVDALFPPSSSACPFPNATLLAAPATAANACRMPSDMAAGARFRINRDGTVFAGLADAATLSQGAYRFTGPVYNGNPNASNAEGGDLDGLYTDLPVFVRQPNGAIKENVPYEWASIPLERLSAFANGHFDVSDNVRVTGQATVTRTETATSLGLSSANINQWGAAVPFGTALYRGSNNPYYEIPDSLQANGTTHPDYTINGRFGVECDAAPSAAKPWLDGQPGCTNSEAWPLSPEIWNLMRQRVDPNAILWASREPDWLRSALGAGRSSSNVTTTMNFMLGLEGDFPSGNHSWDMSISTGRSDNIVNQLGSVRLTTYKDVMASPNFGKGSAFDMNPSESGGFAETVPTCTSGLPIVADFVPSADCVQMLAPALKNIQEMNQTIFEANLVGDLAEMRAGPLQYALGTTYRENSFSYTPDNLSDTQNVADPIAGLFPNEKSAGEFDVAELYGELLVPIVSDGPRGVEHFNLELGARVSDWSMEQMPNLETYKALIDWAVSPRYRIRGGFNRAFRAPNLGELFIRRTQVFAAGGATRDWCSQNLGDPGTFSATPGPNNSAAQVQRSLDLCRQLMGPEGAFLYYDNRAVAEQPTAGGVGVPITFGNEALREEQADTWTIGVAMDILEDWQLTVDWYQIQIEDMIALESGDTTYEACLSMALNPSGSLANQACNRIERNPGTGGGATVERSFTNAGRADFSGVDLSLSWNRQMQDGGRINLNVAANAPIEEITQDNAVSLPIDHAGFNSCGLQLQCQNYDYRLFTTVGYGRNAWNVNLRHQYWPELKNNGCRAAPLGQPCVYNSLPAYGLFSVSGNYQIADKYNLSAGIENLLDEEPPCINQNPAAAPFPTACTHVAGGDGATYDPLGRQFFISMSMDF